MIFRSFLLSGSILLLHLVSKNGLGLDREVIRLRWGLIVINFIYLFLIDGCLFSLGLWC